MSDTRYPGDVRWTFTEALAQLSGAQKPPYGTPAYSRFVNRPLGRRLAAQACVTGLTPNQVSGLSALCTFSAIALVAMVSPSVLVSLVVSLLLVLGYALDSADGQVARLTGLGSPFGEWLDHMIDCTKISVLHLAVLVHLYRYGAVDIAWMFVPMAYLIVANVLFFGMILTDQLKRAIVGDHKAARGSLSVARSVAILPSDYGALCLVFLTLAWTPVFLGLYSFFLLGNAALLVAVLFRWARQLRSLDLRSTS